MATIFIKVVSKVGSGDVLLTVMVKKGTLQDTLKAVVEGKTVTIAKMGSRTIDPGAGPRGASMMNLNWVKEAKEGSILQMKVLGADLPTLKKYEGKMLDFQ
nr:hypothetical protein [Candidatus Sigynarchaeota archaeon]